MQWSRGLEKGNDCDASGFLRIIEEFRRNFRVKSGETFQETLRRDELMVFKESFKNVEEMKTGDFIVCGLSGVLVKYQYFHWPGLNIYDFLLRTSVF